MNELSLVINQNPGSIELNFDALEEQLDKKLSEYKGAVFTEDTKTIAKAEVANLRKLKKDIEDSRKAVKKKWMEPYDAFEKRMKVLSAKVEEPITEINAQVQAFEEERRKAKKEDVTKLFGQMLAEYEDYKEYISLEKLYDNRWENATASMKSIKAELTDKMNGIRNAITMIKATRSDKEADALETDFGTLYHININPRIYPSDKQEQIILRGDQQRCNMYIPANFFGNASPSEVKKGVTFTSINGLKATGTADMSGGISNNNCEAYLVDVTNPTVSFKTASGTIKAYGYAYETTKSQWGGSTTTTVYAFNGTNYYKSAFYGSPAATNITLGVSGGKLTGLPTGLSGGTLLVVRGI